MGSSSRWWLNQDTHSRAASSTASLVFHGARRWINLAAHEMSLKQPDGSRLIALNKDLHFAIYGAARRGCQCCCR